MTHHHLTGRQPRQRRLRRWFRAGGRGRFPGGRLGLRLVIRHRVLALGVDGIGNAFEHRGVLDGGFAANAVEANGQRAGDPVNCALLTGGGC